MPRVLGRLERLLLRACGVDRRAQRWTQYTLALLAFAALSIVLTAAIVSLQHLLPLNPQRLPGVRADLAFNIAVSFATNTNWQSYAGETTLSPLSQMLALTWQHFVSPAAGLAVALALGRGLTRRGDNPEGALGNFWVDLIRAPVYVFLPAALLVALGFVGSGVVQTLAPAVELHTLEGPAQTIAMGPVASQEAIKLLGTNGGGYFNANSAHPFENPTAVTNLIQLLLVLTIPSGLTYAFGKMAGKTRQGWVLWGTMMLLFLASVSAIYVVEAAGPAPLEGKELRFGVAGSALYAAVTTSTSSGAVNAMHESFTPLGSLVLFLNMLSGEVIFGGVGAGLCGMLVLVLLAVFLAGLMVGRSPEYLGKKIEPRELRLIVLYVLVFPAVILGGVAITLGVPSSVAGLANGAHGLSQALYAFASAAGNNGSAFAGLNADTPYWNIGLGIAMLLGRFAMLVPVLAIAGSMSTKKTLPVGPGTLPTDGLLFIVLLVAVVIIVGALTFFPVLSLGPLLEHLTAGR